ncbi:DUF1294 domain-containing protein [Kroppenstedtia sanguinis]|uniref:DUF1294 domain-containing protein n=1 Tax=Kroppenstedtia sanguinis TaxID=1380684 RepID=A0ABW4CBA8_9BACL
MWILIYLLVINGVAFAWMGSDKARAKKGRWRIPERRLFMSGFLGGGLGLWVGMKTFRHKTMHSTFRYGVPLLILWNGIAGIVLVGLFG